ncbi:MAG: hypothetical protein DMG92_13365 [Acidobacteria bacterium]|nr:MAG: hypothetical protein DMG92_13365 [Acidobacteriota bacterium]
MARVAVDIWGKSIVAFSGEIQKHLAADSNSRAFNRRDRRDLTERTQRKQMLDLLWLLSVLSG